MFHLNHVSHAYGATKALKEVSLEIHAGEQVCVIGPSGSGKSTLLGLLNHRLVASGGTVEILEQEVATLSRRELRDLRCRIAWIPQDLGLVPNLRVLQNVLAGADGCSSFLSWLANVYLTSSSSATKVHALLERVGIPEKLYHRLDSLSGGQQQRVAIARALHQQPQVILADEPVSAVDPERARDLVKLLTSVAKEEDIAVVMNLHIVELAREFFPRLIGLREGRIVFDKASDAVTDRELKSLYALKEG